MPIASEKNDDWSELSYEEQLALLRAPNSEYQLMGQIIAAYCDESADHRDPAVYSVCGVLGLGRDWFELGRLWRQALAKTGLEKTGFHMGPCEAGRHPPYDRLTREERDDLQRLFIGIINKTRLWSFASAIRTDKDYPKIQAMIEAQPNYDPHVVAKPYYAAFEHTIEWLAEAVDNGGIPRSEPIAFTFDQQKEHEGIAKRLYDELQQDEAVTFRHRLGALQFDSRLNQVQLQAADVIAYENMRYIREVEIRGNAPRWQYTLLASVRKKTDMGLALLELPTENP